MPIDYGIKVVRAGFDVATAGVLDQVFNTSLNTMKSSLRGIATSTASGQRTITITAAQSYRAGFLAWFKVGSGKWYAQGATEDVSGASGEVNCYVNSDKELVADVYTSSSQTVSIKYVLLVDPGE